MHVIICIGYYDVCIMTKWLYGCYDGKNYQYLYGSDAQNNVSPKRNFEELEKKIERDFYAAKVQSKVIDFLTK